MLNKQTADPSSEPNQNKTDTLHRRSVAAAKGGVVALFRPVLAVLGVILIIIGVPIAFLTPIPFIPIGLPIVIIGVMLLARNSLTGRRWMQGMIAKHPSLKRFAPNWLLKLIFGDVD